MLVQFKKNLKNIILGTGLILFSVAILTFAIRDTLALSPAKTILQKAASSKKSTTSAPKDINLDNLQFSQIERHEVPNAKATVIYIPQLHREPTTTPEDSKNDQAYNVQKEISGMLTQLNRKNGVTYAMDETDLYGPMPPEKVAKVKKGLALIADYKKNLKITLDRYIKNGGSQTQAAKIQTQALSQLAPVERKLYLTGGAAVYSADSSAHVYGSQNQATIQVTTQKLQNLTYLQNRIAQLQGGQKSVASTNSSSGLGDLASLFGNRANLAVNFFGPLSNIANQHNDTKMLSALQTANADLQSLKAMQNFEGNPITPQTTTSNPYTGRTDLSNLQREYNLAQADFMRIAKDQRSQEVCDNIADMMSKNNVKAAALVFGYGHKAQLVDILNRKGISVIVLTPVSENGVPPA